MPRRKKQKKVSFIEVFKEQISQDSKGVLPKSVTYYKKLAAYVLLMWGIGVIAAYGLAYLNKVDVQFTFMGVLLWYCFVLLRHYLKKLEEIEQLKAEQKEDAFINTIEKDKE